MYIHLSERFVQTHNHYTGTRLNIAAFIYTILVHTYSQGLGQVDCCYSEIKDCNWFLQESSLHNTEKMKTLGLDISESGLKHIFLQTIKQTITNAPLH